MNTALKLSTPEETIRSIKENHGQEAINAMLFKSPESVISLYSHLNLLRLKADTKTRFKLESKMAILDQYLLKVIDVNAIVAGIPTTGNEPLVAEPQQIINFEEGNKEEIQQPIVNETKVIKMNSTVVNNEPVYGPTTEVKEETKEEVIEPTKSTVPAATNYYLTGSNINTFNGAIAELKESYRVNGTILYSVQILLKNVMPTLFHTPIGDNGFLKNSNISDSEKAHHKLALNNILVTAGLNPNDFIVDTKSHIPTRIFNWEELVKTSSGWVTKAGKKIKPDEEIQNAEPIVTIESIRKNALERLIMGDLKVEIMKELNLKLASCTDYAYTGTRSSVKLWKEIDAEFRGIATEAENEDIITAAEDAAFDNKEAISSTIKEIVIKGATDKTVNVMNEVRNVFKKMKGYKVFGTKSLKEVITEVKSEMITEEKKDEQSAVKMFKHINISVDRQDVEESITLCGSDISKFITLLKEMVFEKKMWIVAANVARQYGNKFKELKNANESALDAWFNNIVKVETEARKAKEVTPIVENTVVEEPVIVAPIEGTVTEVIKTIDTDAPTVEPKVIGKYEYLSGCKNRNIINKGISDFLTDDTISADITERRQILETKVLPLTRNYRNSKEVEIHNAVEKVIKTNSKLQPLFA